MGSSLAGLLILAVLLTASLMIWRVNLVGNVVIQSASKGALQLEGERARTVPNMVTASANRNNNTLAVTLQNDGATSVPVSGFPDMDVVVIYDLAAQTPLRLTYTATNPPPSGQWTKTSISGGFEPDVWNPTETLAILATLNGADCNKGTVTVGFPNGVIDTNPFICAGLDLYFHSETTTIDTSTYYRLKNDTPADGAAVTISASFTQGVTASRVSPSLNSGRLVYPLTGITAIPAANWDITYRVKRDKADMGFVWFTNANDISIDTVSGTHDGANDVAVLVDSTANFLVYGILVGDTIQNTTDGSSCVIASGLTATTIPCVSPLIGGAENDWDTGDAYTRAAPLTFWRDIDLSPFVPVGATGAIVEVVNASTTTIYNGMVKGKEDTTNYKLDQEELVAESHRWQMVKIDSNRRIQGFIEHTDLDFKLLGYTVGSDPSYFTTPPDVLPKKPTGVWMTVDVSNYVDADADGVILLVDSESNTDRVYAIREASSTFSTSTQKITKYGNTMYLVGLNSAKHFEAFVEHSKINMYLVGQTKGSVINYSTDILVVDPILDSWSLVNADSYGITNAANGLILRAENTSGGAGKISFRHGDNTTDDWSGDIQGADHIQAAIGLRDDNRWYEYMEVSGLNVFIAGYTRLIRMDVHADIDVVIRKSTGNVRATLLTNAANTANITGTDWQTFTVTVAFPAYTVVDQTDYLEIDLFAETTNNISAETVSVEFRIDDPALSPLADQMRAKEVVP